jgi:hypothetical protein
MAPSPVRSCRRRKSPTSASLSWSPSLVEPPRPQLQDRAGFRRRNEWPGQGGAELAPIDGGAALAESLLIPGAGSAFREAVRIAELPRPLLQPLLLAPCSFSENAPKAWPDASPCLPSHLSAVASRPPSFEFRCRLVGGPAQIMATNRDRAPGIRE